MPVLLRLHRVWRATSPEARRLLRVLFVWVCPVPVYPDGRTTQMPSAMTVEIRPGVHRPDLSVLTKPAARAALAGRDHVRTSVCEMWSQALEELSDSVWRIVLNLFARFARPPSALEIAETANLTVAQVVVILADLVSQDLLVMDDSASAIVSAYPFASQPTDHRVELSGRELYAMCAIDALGIAGMFQKDAIIKSRCRICHERIEIGTTRRGKSLSYHHPVGSVVWYDFAYTQTAATSCCPAIALFCSDAHLKRWLLDQNSQRMGCRLTVDEGLEVGRALFEPVLATAPVNR